MKNMWAPWRMAWIGEATEKPEGCIFCQLAAKDDDQASLIVYRSSHCFVILNKFPYNNGHVMIVPYQHTHDIMALDDDTYSDCNHTLRKTVAALRELYQPHAINMGMNMGRAAGAGIEEHIHWHVLPRWDGDTNFMPVIAGVKVISESLESTYESLARVFADLDKKDGKR